MGVQDMGQQANREIPASRVPSEDQVARLATFDG